MKIAVFGYGYWGPNLVRNFHSIGVEVKYIVDIDKKRLQSAKTSYPAINVIENGEEVFHDSSADAVIISLPVFLHYKIARQALLAGKHVLIEKPMTDSVQTTEELIELANKQNLLIMPDHTFLYTGAVRKIKEYVDAGKLGKLDYFDSMRINLGLFQSDINVLWDLAPHDLSILCYLINEKPSQIFAAGISHSNNDLENIAYLTLHYPSNFIAHINVSWVAPVKIRKILIGGEKLMVVYDDIEPTEKIKIYNSGYQISTSEDKARINVDYRTGDIFIPKLDTTEALKGLALDFVNSIENGSEPVSNAQLGLSVVKILEASQKSIKSGQVITL